MNFYHFFTQCSSHNMTLPVFRAGKFTIFSIFFSILVAFILSVPRPIDCSLSPNDSQDLLVTLKGLHQTLSKLVDHLSTGTHDSKRSGSATSRSGGGGGGSSSISSLSPPSGNGASRGGGRPNGSNGVRKSSGSGSSSFGSVGGDYPNQDKPSDSGGPVKKNPGQRPFQVSCFSNFFQAIMSGNYSID